MLTSKQRAYLRGLANTLEPVFIIGKGGFTDGMIKELNDVLEARELIKVKILNNSLESPREVGHTVAERLDADVVQVIGNKFVLYREPLEKPGTIVIPK